MTAALLRMPTVTLPSLDLTARDDHPPFRQPEVAGSSGNCGGVRGRLDRGSNQRDTAGHNLGPGVGQRDLRQDVGPGNLVFRLRRGAIDDAQTRVLVRRSTPAVPARRRHRPWKPVLRQIGADPGHQLLLKHRSTAAAPARLPHRVSHHLRKPGCRHLLVDRTAALAPAHVSEGARLERSKRKSGRWCTATAQPRYHVVSTPPVPFAEPHPARRLRCGSWC